MVLLAGLLLACGRKEYVVEYGVDGYVYPSRLLYSGKLVDQLRIAGDFLYYTEYVENGYEVKKLSVTALAADGERLDFSQAETLAAYRSNAFLLPEGSGEDGEKIDFLSLLDNDYGNQPINMEKKYGRLELSEYAVSHKGDIYCYLDAYMGYYDNMNHCGGVLCRQNPEGERVFRMYLPDVQGLVVDAEDRLFVLTGEELQILDPNGNRLGTIPTEGYHMGGESHGEELFADSEGRIYYSVLNQTHTRSTYQVTGEAGFGLKNAGGFLGEGYMHYCAAPEGNIFRFSSGEDILYKYDRKTGSVRELLKWGESGLMNDGILSVVEITPDILLVNYRDSFGVEGDVYQLTKTSLEELPQKELLVIASPLNSPNLQRAVTAFNASSDTYRVIVDSYGAEYSDEEKRWMSLQLDAALVSANPPDILDLGAFQIDKYAQKGVLEDLTPYIDGSSLDKKDIPDNLLEGLTYDGKFVCIPLRFDIRNIVARTSQVGDLESWTMEDVYQLTRQHPESTGGVLDNGYGVRAQADWLLEEFCAPYYLEAFVDWENWQCSFDHDDFRRLLEWVGQYKWTPEHVEQQVGVIVRYPISIPEEVLLVSQQWLDFHTLFRLETQFEEDVCLLGYPTVDGAGIFPARISEGMGITSVSKHKEVAWEFLEYYQQVSEETLPGEIPVSRAEIEEQYEEEKSIEHIRTCNEDPDFAAFKARHRQQAEDTLSAIESADFQPVWEVEEKIARIVAEEAESYYQGDKSLDRVIELIQNRVQLLLNEMKP